MLVVVACANSVLVGVLQQCTLLMAMIEIRSGSYEWWHWGLSSS